MPDFPNETDKFVVRVIGNVSPFDRCRTPCVPDLPPATIFPRYVLQHDGSVSIQRWSRRGIKTSHMTHTSVLATARPICWIRAARDTHARWSRGSVTTALSQ